MYVCMYVCVYDCMYVRMYLCMIMDFSWHSGALNESGAQSLATNMQFTGSSWANNQNYYDHYQCQYHYCYKYYYIFIYDMSM